MVYSVAYEAIYSNMPEFGLARATERVPPVGGREIVCRRLIKGGTRVAPASPSTSMRPEHPIVQCLEPGEDWRWSYVGEVLV